MVCAILAVGVVSIGRRLKCLDNINDQCVSASPSNRRLTSYPESLSIIAANEHTLDAMAKSIFQPKLYRLFPTKNFKKLCIGQDYITRYRLILCCKYYCICVFARFFLTIFNHSVRHS